MSEQPQPVQQAPQQGEQQAQPAEQQAQQAQPEVAVSSGVVVAADGGQATISEGTVTPEVSNVARPQLDSCPSCKIGLLYLITYDADASHEQGQALFHPRNRSGGSAHRKCFHCDYGDTVALNPTPAPARPVL